MKAYTMTNQLSETLATLNDVALQVLRDGLTERAAQLFYRDTRQPYHQTIVLTGRGNVFFTYETDLVLLNTELAEASVGCLRGSIIAMEVEEENEGKSPNFKIGVASGAGYTWRDGYRLPFLEGAEPTFIHLSGTGPAYRIIGGRLRKVAMPKAVGKLRRAIFADQRQTVAAQARA